MLYIHKHVWVWSSGVSGLLYIWGLDIDRSSGRKETCSSAWGHIYVFLPHGSYEVFGLTKPPVGLRDTSQVSQFAKPSSATKDVAEDPGSLPPILHDLQERSVGRIPATSEHLCRKRLQKEVALCTVAAEHFHSLVAGAKLLFYQCSSLFHGLLELCLRRVHGCSHGPKQGLAGLLLDTKLLPAGPEFDSIGF